MDASSTRSARSLSGTNSPVGHGSHMPRPGHSNSSSAIAQNTSLKGIGSFAERHIRDSTYRAQSVPPSLHDHLSSQHTGTVHHGLPTGVLYGVPPSGDSLCSSSDSCYSPPSDYYPNPRALHQNYGYGQEIVQRPHSALESNYQSLETSPLSVGPPTPVSTNNWNPAFDPNTLAFIPESHCLPPVRPELKNFRKAVITHINLATIYSHAAMARCQWHWVHRHAHSRQSWVELTT